MKAPPRKLTAVLAGSVVVASAAYGVGTQVDDGSATAANSASSKNRDDGPRGRHLSGFAQALGVSEAKLRAALEDLRGDRPAKRKGRGDLAAALAKELGVSEAKVEDVLEGARPRDGRRAGHRRFTTALAKELGIDASKVRSVLRDAKQDRGKRGGPPAFDDLAKSLGVSEAKLRSALQGIRPQGGPPKGDRLHRRLVSALAKGLDKDASEVRAALRKVRAAKEAEHTTRRDEFAQKLADKLGISVAKVKSALPAGGPGHHGPGGGPHGGPGGFDGPPQGGPGGFDDGPGGPPQGGPGGFDDGPGGPPPGGPGF